MIWLWIGLGIICLVALAYWQLIIAEGTYLGSRVVAWTYDLVASRYDGIKKFVAEDERWFVAQPILMALWGVESPLLLDVATGTGRLPLALLRAHFQGCIVGLDVSRGMLRQARAKLQPYGEQVSLVWQDAGTLPFADGTFDAVSCLESLEFMSHPLEVLAELVRVLAPGGVLFVTNRVGREARFLPGRAFPRNAFREALAGQPLEQIEVRAWQVQYDRAIARKQGSPSVDGQGVVARVSDCGQGMIERLAALVWCPSCGGRLVGGVARLSCAACERAYPIREGILHLEAFEGQDGS